MKRFKRGIILILSLALVIVAGCQAIQGVDFNTVLKNTLKVTSAESKQSVELKLLMNEEAYEGMPEEEIALMKLFSNMKIQLDNVKVQDATHSSFAGKLLLGDSVSIGFSIKQADTTAVIEVEGAKLPIVLDVSGSGIGSMLGTGSLEDADASSDEDALTAIGKEITDSATSYFIDNLPNPDKISVNAVQEPINGVNTSLFHVKAELSGTEIWSWVKKYVDVLANDREGLETFVKQIVTIMNSHPELWEDIGVNPFEQSGLDMPTTEDMIAEMTDELEELFVSLQEELKAMEEESGEELKQIFNDDSSIKAELYVDSKMDIRKQAIDVTLKPSEQALFPLDGLSLHIESEMWNVNGKVEADAPVVPEKAIRLDQLDTMQGYQFLRMFDKQSDAYALLDQLQIGQQTVELSVESRLYPAIVTPKYVTIIPLRKVAEQLGATVKYDKKTKNVTVYDEATNTTIVLKEGSDRVTVNGKPATWSFVAKAVDGTLYVAGRNFANALGAKVHWDDSWGSDTFVIEREVH
ncbi:copper amine oxidase N-terminal domain-containing protein [Paenibacillus glycanilyticus]|uniref:copper amine oxidase N-terminal domain-containing protein n=1 Tax=Paenibacillus glycanilyticus TaxID=126569 RepID=UPI00203AA57C|nr:copper amine oxidase N-terminal domain-containing protein [Paenibacillus glycanilyticus]MCM3629288.1 copper amine oxidase N-terminal domain-containing protein [Paenibacillus glycanilyticus]